MAPASWLKKHRQWEDWVGIGLGVLVLLSPWIAGQTTDPRVVFIATVAGLLVMALAQFELVALHRSLEIAEVACGLVLVASPFVLGYAFAGALGYWHLTLGALVAALGLLKLWQDWRSSDEELARHGQ